MRTHTSQFKDEIKQYGRQFNDRIYYNNVTYDDDHIFSVNYSVDTTLCKSIMQTLKIDTDISLNVGDTLDYGISLENTTDEIRFNNFIVNKIEEQKDKKSNLVTCYDNMINAMKDYETPKVNGVAITYPITIRDYLIAICGQLGLTFRNSSDTFTNYNKQVTSEHYVDTDGNSLGYTFRDVLDDIAEVVGGFIRINNSGQLEIKDISNAIGKNIFNSTDSLLGYINNSTSKVSYNTGYRVSTFKIEPNTTYTISKRKNSYNYVGTAQSDSLNATISNLTNMQDYTTGRVKATITTGANDNYLFIDLGPSSSSNTIRNSIQVELGTEVTNFESYGIDTINEDYFKDKNVNVGKKIGPYNVVVLSRVNEDNLYYPTTLPANPIEFKISDNAILDQDNREDFIQGIYNKINGLEFYLNDFATNGILYYEIGDKYNVSIDSITYPCLMLNDDIKRTTGLKENIRTDEPKQSVTEFKYASSSDKVEITSRNAKILVDKANASINQIVSAVGDNGQVTSASIIQSINDDTSSIKLEADKIDINGVVSANNNFEIDMNGNMSCNNANITGGYLELIDDPDTYDDRLIIKKKNSTEITTATSEYVVIKRAYNDDENYAHMNLETGFTHAVSNNNISSYSSLRSDRLTLGHTENGVTTHLQLNADGTSFIPSGLIVGDTTINGDLYNNSLDMFDDSAGNDWQEMLRTKIDYCINNVNTSKWNGQFFINGGWAGVRYGFGIFSKIGDWRQLVWFCNMGIYYVSKDGSNNYGYDRVGKGIVSEIQPSHNLNDFKIDGKYSYNRGDEYYDNCPTSDGIHILNVTSNGGTDWVIQEDYVMRWGATSVEKYIRQFSPPGWSNWQRII